MQFNFILKIFLVGILLVCKQVQLYAQATEWVKTIGGTIKLRPEETHSDVGKAIVTDAWGNIYITGYFADTVDFNPGSNIADTAFLIGSAYPGMDDIFVCKLDAAGNFIWAKSIGSSAAMDQPADMAIDASGNLYITGSFFGKVDFNPGTGIADTAYLGDDYGSYAFVLKLDINGNYVWAKSLGNALNMDDYPYTQGRSIAVDAVGNVYTTGSFGTWSPQGGADFDPGPGVVALQNGSNDIDIFISKLDANGNYVFAKSIGGADMYKQEGTSIALDAAGNIYVGGYFGGENVDFNPAAGVADTAYLIAHNYAGIYYINNFILKLNNSGDYIWAKRIPGLGFYYRHWWDDYTLAHNSYDYYPTTIVLDGSGSVYAAGTFQDASPQPDILDFDPGPNTAILTPEGGTDICITKLDANGNYLWAKKIGGAGDDESRSMTIDAFGKLNILARYSGTVDFDPGSREMPLTSDGATGIAICKLDINGNFLCARNIAGDSVIGNDIVVAADGSAYTTGCFVGTVNFNVQSVTISKMSNGGEENDIFVHKANLCVPNDSTLAITECNSYNFNGKNYTQSGRYKDTLANVNGLDSIVTLDLVIYHDDDTVLNYEVCDSFRLNNDVTYTASGNYTYHLRTASGCDSTITLNLKVHYSSSVTFNLSGCGQLVYNDSVYVATGTYLQHLKTVSGCDSILTLNITINSLPEASISFLTDKTIQSTGSNGTYTWVNCDSNYAAVPGAVSQSFFTPGATGNYALVITASGGCKDTSACLRVVTTGIHTLELHNTVQVYPNPADDKVNVKLEKALNEATIRIVNITGQVLKEYTNLSGKDFQLDISAYVPGLYYVVLINENTHVARIKLTKN